MFAYMSSLLSQTDCCTLHLFSVAIAFRIFSNAQIAKAHQSCLRTTGGIAASPAFHVALL
jgi:hypothetical protein